MTGWKLERENGEDLRKEEEEKEQGEEEEKQEQKQEEGKEIEVVRHQDWGLQWGGRRSCWGRKRDKTRQRRRKRRKEK